MADDFGLGGILGSFAGVATSQSAMGWLGMGINIILSTIVGGIVLLVVMEILSKGWGESIHIGKVFGFLLIINLINTFGVLGILYPFVSFIPMVYLILPLVLWIVLMKLFFSEMSFMHAAITGVIGFVLSILAMPYLIGIIRPMLPI